MKSGKNSGIKRRSGRKDIAKAALQPGPEFFDRVEFRRIGRQKQERATNALGSSSKPLLGMERRIVHYDHSAFVQRWQKLMRKPEVEQAAVHCSAVLKGRNDLMTHFCGNNPTALVSAPADAPKYLLASGRIPIFTVQVGIDAAFVHIGNLFWWDILDLLLIRCYPLFFLFLIPGRLFFLVI